MWTQRDQVQAYQFLRRRLVSALVAGDANHPVSPSRRLVIGCAVGVALALLVTAGFGIYGLLKPGASTDWRQAGQVVVAKDTGASYVLGSDKRLHPMLNYASARLLAGGDGTATASVSTKALRSAPRGATLGIAGAPEALPAAADLVTGPWTVCAQQPSDGPSDSPAVGTALLGARPAGTLLRPGTGILVRDPKKAEYLLSGGVRYRVAASWVPVALGFDQVTAAPVTWSFIDAVAAGPDLAAPEVAGRGSAGPRLAGRSTVAGQVLRVGVGTAGYHYYVVHTDAVVPVTETEASLLVNAPGETAAYPGSTPKVITVSAAELAGATRGAPEHSAFPAQVPTPVAVPPARRLAICATGRSATMSDIMVSAASVPAGAAPVAVTGGDDRSADLVYVPPGRAALVSTGTVYLITDQGQRFPVSGEAARKALGYGSARAVGVPATVLALFPTGPTLSATAAARAATG